MVDQKKALDQKTRQLASKKTEKGQELESTQALQQQLMAIQAERNQNLAIARTESKASSEVNQVLSQAAQVGAMTMAETPQAIETPVVNPATQNILAKYGLGQPKFQKSVSHSQQVTKQNITINNNTTSNTTNNVQVPANSGGPIQGRPLAFKPKVASDSTGKFKAWISSAFARQTEEGARRDREYRQRENSLAKSAGKMMKKLEELGRTITTRMDPRRIGSTITSQIRTLLFVLGIGYMAQNWPKILEKVADIEEGFKKFLRYIGIGVNGKSELHKKIVELLGGNAESENAFQALRKLISNDDPQNPGMIQELAKYLHDKVEERREAMKLVKFPDLDLSDIPGTLKQVAGYLGDILTAMVSGSEGVKNSISRQVERTATTESSQYMKESGDLTRKDWDKKLTTASGDKEAVDIGTMSLFEKGENQYRGLTQRALNSSGELNTSYGAEATVSQGEELSRLLENATTQGGTINTAQITTGLRRLKTTADEKGMIPVSQEFIDSQLSAVEKRQFSQSKDIIPKDYFVVAREKNKTDRILEESAPEEMAGNAYLANTIINETPVVGKARRDLLTFSGGIMERLKTYPRFAAVSKYLEGAYNKWTSNDYRLEVVPKLRPGDIDTGERQRVIEISSNVIQKIADKISGKEGIKIDTANQEFLEGVEKELTRRRTTQISQEIDKLNKNNKIASSPTEFNAVVAHADNKKIDKLQKELSEIQRGENKRDLKISETFEGINKTQALEEKHKREREEAYSRRERSADAISGTVSEVIETGKELYNESPVSKYFGKINYNTNTNTGVNESESPSPAREYFGNGNATGDKKKLMAFAVDYIQKKGYTPEQAAGIVGNIVTESALNPGAFNSEGGGSGAFGLAQWRGDRQRRLIAKYGENPSFGQQLDYILDELSSSEKLAGEDLQRRNTAEAAADSIRRNFERPGSRDLIKTLPKARGHAVTALKSWKESEGQIEDLYGFRGSPSGRITSEEIMSSSDETESEEPMNLFQLFIDNMKKAILNFGNGISKLTSDIRGQLPKPAKKIERWNGPITSEFSNYDDYLKNPGNIEPGLSYVGWANRVFDMTGSSPLDLIAETKSQSKKPQQEKKPQPEEDNFPYVLELNKESLSPWQDKLNEEELTPWKALIDDEENRKTESLINKVSDSIIMSPENKDLKEQLDQAFLNKVIDAQRYIRDVGRIGEWAPEGETLKEISVTAENLSKYLDPAQYETYQDYVDKLKEKGLEHKIIGENEFAMINSGNLEPTEEEGVAEELGKALKDNTEATIGQTQVEAKASGIELDPENNVFSQFLTGDFQDINKDPKLEYLEKINLGVQSLIEGTGRIQAIQRVNVHTTAKVVDAAREGANATREVAPILASVSRERIPSPIDWNSIDVSHRWGEFGGGNYDVN